MSSPTISTDASKSSTAVETDPVRQDDRQNDRQNDDDPGAESVPVEIDHRGAITPERMYGLLLSVVVLGACVLGWIRARYPATLESWDFVWYDRIASTRPSDDLLSQYAVILVDDESLAVLGDRWPISRATWARLIRIVGAAGARVIALSVWFEAPVSLPGLEMADGLVSQLEELEESHPLPEITELLDSATEGLLRSDSNKQLHNAVVVAGNVILGMACINGVSKVTQSPLPDWMIETGTPSQNLPEVKFQCADLSTTYPELGVLAAGVAGVNRATEPDGVTRRYPLHFAYRGTVFPSLAVAVLAANGSSDALLDHSAIHQDGSVPLIRPFATSRIATLSMIDVLDAGESDHLAKLLAGKNVFIGVHALGAGGTITMPGHARVADVFSHVIAAVDVQRGALVSAHSPALSWSVVGSILALIALAWLCRHLSVRASLLVCVTSCAFSLLVANWMLERGALITLVPWWFGAAGVGLVRVGARMHADRRIREETRRIRGAFQHYVAPEIIDELMSHRGSLRLGGERKMITALFADIVGFTRIAEDMEPVPLVQLLNELLTATSDAIVEAGGTIDKFVGDATVAMFGAPIAHSDHAYRACRAALSCQARVAQVRARWRARKLPDIHVRIGLNTGQAVVGNVGSQTRFDYTMLGDMVNLAARLEGTNKAYGTDILVGEVTREQIGDAVVFREVDRVQVKGKHRAVSIYEPVGLIDDVPSSVHSVIEDYERALALYRKREFAEALPIFADLAERGDRPARTLCQRVTEYLREPPPSDWDGTFVLTHK